MKIRSLTVLRMIQRVIKVLPFPLPLQLRLQSVFRYSEQPAKLCEDCWKMNRQYSADDCDESLGHDFPGFDLR